MPEDTLQPGRDMLSPEARSRLMSRIRGRDTRPEVAIRKALFALGLRYHLHDAGLPGRPDLVFRGRRAVIFVHGCYWHGHDCHLFQFPAHNAGFWRSKIEGNVARDRRNEQALRAANWRILTVWECAIRGKTRLGIQAVVDECARWLRSDEAEAVIRGR
jgi:DNA mismatch endonuclease (patch repair protein)